MDGHINRVFTLAFHPQQHILASGSTDRTLRLWEVDSGACLSVRQSDGPLRQLVFDSGGQRLIVADDSDTLKVWETDSGRLSHELRAERLYDGLDLTGAVGLSPAQRASLLSLGAVDRLASEGKAGDPE
jgi:WD40 repeat protein